MFKNTPQVDTGAAVTVFNYDVHCLQDIELTKTSQVLRGDGNTQLPIKGLISATLKYRESKLTEFPTHFSELGKLKTECHIA